MPLLEVARDETVPRAPIRKTPPRAGFFVGEEWRSDFTHISMKLESRELMLDLIARGIEPVLHLVMRDSWSLRLWPGMLGAAFSVKN